MYYAQLNEQGRVVAVTQTAAEVISPSMVALPLLDSSLIGATYQNGAFVPAVAPPPVRHVTRLAFLSRFTDAEAVAIDLASIGATVEAASMRRYMAKVNAATFIDLDRPDTRAGVQQLEAVGLLAAGRAAVILDTPIESDERPL